MIMPIDHVVGHELAGVHERLGLVAELGAFRDSARRMSPVEM